MDTSPFKNTCKTSHFKCDRVPAQCRQAWSRVRGGGGGCKSNVSSQAWQSPCINHLALQLKTGLASLCISKTTSKQHSSRKCSLVNSNELWVLGFSLFACACLERVFGRVLCVRFSLGRASMCVCVSVTLSILCSLVTWLAFWIHPVGLITTCKLTRQVRPSCPRKRLVILQICPSSWLSQTRPEFQRYWKT